MTRELEVKKLAEQLGYQILFEKPENKLIRFRRNDKKIDVWFSTMTIGIYHEGKEAVYKRDQTFDNLVDIFDTHV